MEVVKVEKSEMETSAMEEVNMDGVQMDEVKTEEAKVNEPTVEDILFVSVKEEPHSDEECMPESEFPFKDELKHEETEINDVHFAREGNVVQQQVPPTGEPSCSNVFIATRESSEYIIGTAPLPPLPVVIKEEVDGGYDDNTPRSADKTEFSCIICNDSFPTTKEVNEHSKSVHNFSCCEYCLEHMGRYSCSFKGAVCTHDYKMPESAASSSTAEAVA